MFKNKNNNNNKSVLGDFLVSTNNSNYIGIYCWLLYFNLYMYIQFGFFWYGITLGLAFAILMAFALCCASKYYSAILLLLRSLNHYLTLWWAMPTLSGTFDITWLFAPTFYTLLCILAFFLIRSRNVQLDAFNLFLLIFLLICCKCALLYEFNFNLLFINYLLLSSFFTFIGCARPKSGSWIFAFLIYMLVFSIFFVNEYTECNFIVFHYYNFAQLFITLSILLELCLAVVLFATTEIFLDFDLDTFLEPPKETTTGGLRPLRVLFSRVKEAISTKIPKVIAPSAASVNIPATPSVSAANNILAHHQPQLSGVNLLPKNKFDGFLSLTEDRAAFEALRSTHSFHDDYFSSPTWRDVSKPAPVIDLNILEVNKLLTDFALYNASCFAHVGSMPASSPRSANEIYYMYANKELFEKILAIKLLKIMKSAPDTEIKWCYEAGGSIKFQNHYLVGGAVDNIGLFNTCTSKPNWTKELNYNQVTGILAPKLLPPSLVHKHILVNGELANNYHPAQYIACGPILAHFNVFCDLLFKGSSIEDFDSYTSTKTRLQGSYDSLLVSALKQLRFANRGIYIVVRSAPVEAENLVTAKQNAESALKLVMQFDKVTSI